MVKQLPWSLIAADRLTLNLHRCVEQAASDSNLPCRLETTSPAACSCHYGVQVLDCVRPEPDDIVLPKTSSSLFQSTIIDYLLRNLGVGGWVRGQLGRFGGMWGAWGGRGA